MHEKNPLLQGITSIFGNRHQMFKLMLGFFGGVSLFFGGLMLPLSLTGDMVEGASRWGGVLMGLFFLAVSAFCLIKLYTVNRRDRRFKRYQALIGKQKRIPLGWLADGMKCSKEAAVRNIRQAMSHGWFSEAYIDEKNELLLFPNDSANGRLITVQCPNCGAGAEVLSGYPAKCRYCGCLLDTNDPE